MPLSTLHGWSCGRKFYPQLMLKFKYLETVTCIPPPSLSAISTLPMLVRSPYLVTFGGLKCTDAIENPFQQGGVLFPPLPIIRMMTQAPCVNLAACGKDLFHGIWISTTTYFPMTEGKQNNANKMSVFCSLSRRPSMNHECFESL